MMPVDQELTFLRRRVREIEEELAEYRRAAEPDQDWKVRAETSRLFAALTSGQAKLGSHGWGVKLIAFLMDHPGVLHSHARLLPQIVSTGETCSHSKTVHVAASRARALLRPHGLDTGIERAWALGYRMTPACADAVKILIGEAAA